MKKISLLAGFSLICYALLSQGTIQYAGQQSDADRIHCYVDEISMKDAGEGIAVYIKNGTRIQEKSSPDLPQLTASVIVDDVAKMQLNILHESFEEFENIDVVPSKGNLIRTVDPTTIPFSYGEAYDNNAFYPGKLAELTEPFIEGQYRAQSIRFYPVQYNPVTKVLRVYHHIEVEVSATGETGINPLPQSISQKLTPLMDEVYKSRFINYEENNDRYTPVSELGNMLVISPLQYFDELEPWIQWKKEKGINVTLVNVATINSTSAINSYVENFYNANGLTYLQLVGDESQVPSYLVNNSGGQGYCDVCYGYISGNDHYSEIFVGRFLVHNGAELTPVITKVLEYEKNPNTSSDWFSVAMGIGSNEGAGYGDNGEADWQHINNIKSDLIGFTYNDVWEKYDGNHTSSSPTGGATADASGNPSSSNLSQVINSGCSLINYTGHGNHSVIVTGNYTNSQINALTNYHKFPYFIIVGCCVGDFDDDSGSGDTFGEAWLKCPNASNPTGGIGGSFSSVFQSWAPPMEGQDEMNQLIANVGSYPTRHTIGSIHYYGCASMNDAYGSSGAEMTDTWIVMGDPSVQLRTAFPTQITASHPVQVAPGVSSLVVTSSSQSALVALTYQGEIVATGLIQGGTCTLTFSALNVSGNLLLTLTNFNTIPYQAAIPVQPLTGATIVENAHAFHDLSGGNNNGQADYSETIAVDITLQNTGNITATNVTGVLTTGDQYVSIVDGTHNFGNIAAGVNINGSGAFTFLVDNVVPDQHIAEFTVTYSDSSGNTWTSAFEVTLNAPVLSCTGNYAINDGNNGRLDSGDNATVVISVVNNGHAATSANTSATLSSTSSYITISGSPDLLGTLAPGATVQASFQILVSGATPTAETAGFDFDLTANYYATECSFEEVVNQIMEDWETGDASQFNWQFSGNSDWFVTSTNPFEGNFCMQSGDIGNNQSTTLEIIADFTEDGTVSFARKTSCESSYDFLKFRINGVNVGSWSGEQAWDVVSFPVNSGSQTLTWVYLKDDVASFGTDAAWIDDITLPAYESLSITEAPSNRNIPFIFPNPVSDKAWINIHPAQSSNINISLIDYTGRIVRMLPKGFVSAGKQRMEIDLTGLASGTYFIQVQMGEERLSEKIIKH